MMTRFFVTLLLICSLVYVCLALITDDMRWPIIIPDNADQVVHLAALGGDQIYDVSWSPDGSILAVVGTNSTYLYYANDLTQPYLMIPGHNPPMNGASFSPDGTQLVVGDSSAIYLWDIEKRALLDELWVNIDIDSPADLNGFALDWDNARLVISHSQRRIALFDIRQNFSSDSPILAQVMSDSQFPVITLRFFDHGTQLWIGTDHPILIHNVERWIEAGACCSEESDYIMVWPAEDQVVRQIIPSRDGHRMAVADLDGNIQLRDSQNATLLWQQFAHIEATWAVALSPDDRVLASAGWDGVIKLWDTETGQRIAIYRGFHTALTALDHHPDGRKLAIGGWDGRVWVIDTSTEERTFVRNAAFAQIWDIDFSYDDLTLAAALDNGDIWLWDAANWTDQAVLHGHGGAVNAVSFSPDGIHLASASMDHTIRIWNTQTRQTETTIPYDGPAVSVAYSPDGGWLAVAPYANRVELHDVQTGTVLRTLEAKATPLTRLVFSPDGRWLALEGRIYDTATGEQVSDARPARPSWEERAVWVTFAPDGAIVMCYERAYWDVVRPGPLGLVEIGSSGLGVGLPQNTACAAGYREIPPLTMHL